MSVIKKPDLKIFAQDAKTGEVETFPDVLRGWGVTLDRTAGKPPLEWFNALGKRVDEWLMYLTQRGVAEWDTTLSYPKTAIVQFNSVVYVSIKETKGEQPDKSQASWSTLGVFLGLGNYYNKTESDTKFQPKGNYAPAGDYATNTALTNGLNTKLNTTGGAMSGPLGVQKIESTRLSGTNKQVLSASTVALCLGNPESISEVRLQTNNGNARVDKGLESYLIYHEGFKPTPATIGAIPTTALTQNVGSSTTLVMSQKIVTELINSLCPVGSSILWNTSAPVPSNYWPNEGRSFSETEYPELAKIFTNLRLPDDRGYGIRVADNGKGIDAGRTVGTYQEDAVQSVTGSVRNLSSTSADYQYAGAFFGSDKGGIEYTSGTSGQRFRTLEFDIGRVARTANETRMKNVAKILITRVK